jgi:RsiW-degrading membrane proteinase PrsW (M82 family)
MLVLYLIFVALPVVLWFLFFLSKDRCDPGPRRLMITMFILGTGLAFFAGALENLLARITAPGFLLQDLLTSQVSVAFIISVLSAAVIEETLKYAALKGFFYERYQFNQIADGVFYGVTLALGFSFVENSAYFFSLSGLLTSGDFLNVIFARAVFTVLLHLTTGGLLGYYMGKRKFSPNHDRKYAWSLLWAIALHAFFNITGVYVSLIVVVPTFAFLVYKMSKPDVLKIWKISNTIEET